MKTTAKQIFRPRKTKSFLKACEVYIERLIKNGNLIKAQPLIREGKMLVGSNGAWTIGPYSESKEVIVGYYHILANDIEEALAIAKDNPEFAYTTTARVEVRPIKAKEVATAYVYPK